MVCVWWMEPAVFFQSKVVREWIVAKVITDNDLGCLALGWVTDTDDEDD